MKGIFIPMEFYKVKELNGLERDVLALYKYYTEDGNNKCCSLNSVQIAEVFNVSSRYIKRVRKHLSELGYIKIDGRIKVTYLGVQVGSTVPTQKGTTVPLKGEPQYTSKGTTVHPGVNHSSPQKGTTVPLKGEPQFPHKKEKEKKEIKKEEKWVTNIKLLFARLPKDYQTKERVSYIKDNYMDKLNEVDFNDGGILDTWIPNIKNVLNKVYPQDFIVEKEEPKSNTIDVL